MNIIELLTKSITLTALQGKRAHSGTFGSCRYKMETTDILTGKKETLKCAVGCIIDDNLYELQFEGAVINGHSDMSHSQKLIKAVESSNDIQLNESELIYLREVQRCHDRSGYPDSFTGDFLSRVKDCINTDCLPHELRPMVQELITNEEVNTI